MNDIEIYKFIKNFKKRIGKSISNNKLKEYLEKHDVGCYRYGVSQDEHHMNCRFMYGGVSQDERHCRFMYGDKVIMYANYTTRNFYSQYIFTEIKISENFEHLFV